MYDTVNMTLFNHDCNGIHFIDSVPELLTKVTNQGIGESGNRWVSGSLDSLKVNISNTTISIKDRSLCKYYLGENFKTLSKGDTQRAIEKISDCLHLPFDRAKITRIDLAHNIVLKHPPELYYPYLGEAKFYQRLLQPNSIYYNNQLRQLCFYNKKLEQAAKKQSIPELYNSNNPIRYELRFKSRLKQQLKVNELTASMLYDEKLYRSMSQRWKDEYLHIQKIQSKLSVMKPTGSKKEFTDQAVLALIGEVGQETILSMLKEWQGKKEITKKQAYELRNYIKSINTPKNKDVESELITELTAKIKQVAKV